MQHSSGDAPPRARATKAGVFRLLPSAQAPVVARFAYTARTLWRFRGTRICSCPCCGQSGRFRAFGHPPRYDSECRRCRSLERHRLLALAIAHGAIRVQESDVLHFAPEAAVTSLVRPGTKSYETADLNAPHVDHSVDMQGTGLPGASWDVVLALHVLEHVPDDARALQELHRLLRPGGTLVVMVPIVEGWPDTDEGGPATSPSVRLQRFGQHDHVRLYGRDFRKRIADAGFQLSEFTGSPSECVDHGLIRGETIFLAERAQQ